MSRIVSIALLLFASVVVLGDDVRVTFTEEDLNRLLRDVTEADGWRRIAGERDEVSRGLRHFSYAAHLSEPRLTLDGGGLGVTFEIRQAELNLGSFERKMLSRRTRCENLGLRVDPGRPVSVALDVSLSVDDGGLRMVPQAVHVNDARKRFRLVKPSRCRGGPLPRTLLWWLGRPLLRRKLDRLDELMLDGARRIANDLVRRESLSERWDVGGGELILEPSSLDVADDSLTVGFALSGSSQVGNVWPEPRRTQIAISESFLNDVLRTAAGDVPGEPRKPGRTLSRVLRSDAIYVLIPGLRALDSTEGLRFRIRLDTPPRFDLRDDRAPINLHLRGLHIDIVDVAGPAEQLLGTLTIDETRIGLAPRIGAVEGLAFRLVENRWSVSAEGVEQDVELIAATLQEIVFGEIFQTRYRPLFHDGVAILSSEFRLAGVAVVEGALVIELRYRPPAAAAPTRTGTLRGSL